MADRFTLLYRFSTDYGATWVDLTPQVDSLQTSITNNLCTNNFTSAKDEATFVMPETPLFEADGVTPTPKKLLIDALMGNDDILIEINAPGPVNVLWDNNLVLWNGNEVLWKNSTRRFTGYADRSSISLRSYPLPPNLTVKVQDVSTLHLDDKVSENICLEGKKISEIVSALLGYAGYTDIGSTALDVADDVVLEAFVIDKDKANSYRSYIDTLLFEAGGYVLDFNEDGQANIVHLQWDGSVVASRAIDNPMNADGVSIRSAYLKEDGVKLKWSTLAWSGAGQKVWQSNISQESVDGVLTGEKIQPGRYWPNGAEITPQFMQYDAKLLDSAYLTRESRKQNEDLTIIMAKDVSVRMDAMRNGQPYTFPIPAGYPIPTSPTDFTAPPYNLTQNPTIWPTKAWYLLYNNENSDIDLLFFSIYGNVLYRQKLNTVETANSSNPKEYESTYIYSESHAQRFLQFYWHFLQTSRYQFSWKEPNRSDALNAVVAVGIKGNGSTQKALIAGKTSTWVHDNMEIISYSAVGIDTYSPATLVPTVIAPSSATPQVQPTRSAIAAAFSTVPSFTLAEWQDMGKAGTALSWTVTNASSFNAGDLAVINGKISDMDNTDIQLYMDVSAVDTGTISGTAVSVQYVPITKNWDFTLNTETYIINRRDVSNLTEVIARANVKGYPSAVLEWEARDASGTTISTGSGSTFTVYIPFENANNYVSPISIIMSDQNGLVTPLEKKISAIEETEYDHDFGAWEPQTEGTRIYVLPDHFDSYTVIDGDFFVAKVTFSLQGTAVSSPTGNPNEQGWMERYGNGTGTKPYYYLVSTDTSVQGGKTYYVAAGDIYTEGIPYIYNNNSWNNAIPATAENSGRLLRCLGSVLSDPNIQPSTSALYAWFENLVAKNAVLENLVAMFLQVGPGTGLAGSGFRFRALNDDGNGSPVFDVYYGDKRVFQIDVTSGDIFFGGGLVYHAASDTIEANSAVFNGIQINNANGGEANFGSAIFRQEGSTVVSLSITSTGSQGRTIYDWILTTFNIQGPTGVVSGWYSQYFPCTCSRNANVKFMRAYRQNTSQYGYNVNEYAAYFYDSNYALISSLNAERYETSQTDKNPFSVGDTISTVTGGNVMELVNLPTSSSGLTSGRVWRDVNNGNVLKIVP